MSLMPECRCWSQQYNDPTHNRFSLCMPYAPIRLFLCKSQTLSSPLCVGGAGGGGQHGGGGGGGGKGEVTHDTANSTANFSKLLVLSLRSCGTVGGSRQSSVTNLVFMFVTNCFKLVYSYITTLSNVIHICLNFSTDI